MGGILGGIGSAVGGKKASDAAKEQAQAMLQAAQIAAQTARLGYDYLTTGQGAPYANTFLRGGQAAGNEMQGLLGLGGNSQAAQQAFNKFLGSTNYNFQLGQGMNAITGADAAKGMLGSGATLKALNNYGQNMAGNALQGYMSNLGNLQTLGQDTLKTIGAAGSQAGQAGSTALMNGATNAANLNMQGTILGNQGMMGLLGGIGSAYQQGPPSQSLNNSWSQFFGNLF